MAGFDRRAVAVETVRGLSDNEIDRVTWLRMTGEKFTGLMAEFRDALERAYTEQSDPDGQPDAADVVDDNSIVPSHDESELAALFVAVDAVWQLELHEFDYDSSGRMADFAESALREVFVNGMHALIAYVEDRINSAEAEHEDDEDGEDGEDVTGE